MSTAQHKLRVGKLVKQFATDRKCWTDKTYLLRCTLHSFSNLEVSLQDRKYLDTRWHLIEEYLLCTSAAELAMKMEISKFSETFQPIDYVAIAFGFCQQSYNGYIFEPDVIVDMVDNYDFFDSAFKNTKFLRMLLKCVLQNSICYLGRKDAPRKLFAHIVKKFPSVMKMNFMFIKTKRGKLVRKVKDEDLQAWY